MCGCVCVCMCVCVCVRVRVRVFVCVKERRMSGTEVGECRSFKKGMFFLAFPWFILLFNLYFIMV